MRFLGRDLGDRNGAGRAEGRRRAVRLVPGRPSLAPGGRPELLESRLLPSGLTTSGLPASAAPALSGEPAIVVPVLFHLAEPPSASSSNMTGDPSGAVPSSWSPVPMVSLADATVSSPEVTIVRTVTHPVETTSGMMVVTDPTSGSLGEEATTPVIVIAPPDNDAGRAFGSANYATAGAGGLAPSQDAVSPFATDPGAAIDPDSSDSSVSVPDDRHVDVQGILDPTHDIMTVDIPVGPMTQQLGVTVRPGPGMPAGDAPVLTGLTLEDRDGDTLAELGPVLNPQTNGQSAAITVSLNGAPVGGNLVVQISAPRGASLSSSALTSGGTSVSALFPFLMDIQRQDAAASGSLGGLGALESALQGGARAGIGTLTWTATSQDDQTGSSDTSSSNEPAAAPESQAVVDPGSTILAGDESAADWDGAADLSGRVAAGPLASRSAAPLGPDLLSVLLDPTPTVDRHERGLFQAIDGRVEPAEDHGLATGRFETSDAELARADVPADEEWDAESGGHITVAGLGSLPLAVPARRMDSGTYDLDALLAAQRRSIVRNELAAVVAGDEQRSAGSSSLSINAAAGHGDGRPAPDYLTVACVLAVGMGLTSGPLIPHLLRLFPGRNSRWRVVPAGAARFFRGARPAGRPLDDLLRRR